MNPSSETWTQVDQIWEEDEFAEEDAFANDYLYSGMDEMISQDFESTQRQLTRKKLSLQRKRERDFKKAKEADLAARQGDD